MGLIVDLFAGGGGASVGIEAATLRAVNIAINHSRVALAVHEANHPGTHHLQTDVWDVNPSEATQGQPVDLLWASPDCTHFSVAKGGKPRSQKIRSLAWVVCKWARDVRPAIICLENVPEFVTWGPLGKDRKPLKARKGETFRRWVRQLERLGYVVEFRVLDASLYGAPTRRRRLFLVARCDGQPIVWPKPTHGHPITAPGLKPFRTAAECIDWSIPCPSIFTRKKPLAQKTLARIAKGLRKFVFENPSPFIVKVNHGDDARTGTRTHSLDEPLTTITASSRGHALCSPTLIQTGYGERKGQSPRSLDLHEPLGTVVAGGAKHALVSAFLAKHYGGNTTPGSSLASPMDTVTTQDHHAIVTARMTLADAADLQPPQNRAPAVRAFLTTYFGSKADVGQDADDPLRTVTTRDRFGLVTVAGIDFEIVDIGMRMLEPHELLAAQFGRFAEHYDLSAARTKSAKVRLIGNSVCPEVAEAVVAANRPGVAEAIVAANRSTIARLSA